MRVQRGTATNLGLFGETYKSATPLQRDNRKHYAYTGRGLYHGRGGYWGRTIGGALGGLFGDSASGAKWGDRIGDAAGVLMGRGAYVTNDTIGAGSNIPSFGSGDSQGNTVITFREYICDIYAPDPSTTAWAPQVFTLNPGIEATFPHLAQIAQNYEEYELMQCMFTFKSNIAPIGASSSGQVGEVIMATNYNASAAPYPDKQTALQAALAASCRASENMMHGIECDPKKLSGPPGKYIRAGPVNPSEDIKTYDHGILQVAVTGIPQAYANQPIGELWCAYTVSLRKPKKFTSLGLGISRDVFALVDPSSDTLPFVPTTPSTSRGVLTGQQNRIGCKLQSSALGTNVIFPAAWAGNVKIRLVLRTSAPVVVNASCNPFLFGNVSLVADMVPRGAGNPWLSQVLGSGSNDYSFVYEGHFRVDIVGSSAVNNRIEFVTAWPGVPIVSAMLDIEEYNTAFNDPVSRKLLLVDSNGTLQSL